METNSNWIANLHPLLVHFPIALLFSGIAIELAGLLLKRYDRISFMVDILIWTGTFFGIITLISGLQAGSSVSQSGGIATVSATHSLIAKITVAYFLLYSLIRIVRYKKRNSLKRVYAFLIFLSALQVWSPYGKRGTLVVNWSINSVQVQSANNLLTNIQMRTTIEKATFPKSGFGGCVRAKITGSRQKKILLILFALSTAAEPVFAQAPLTLKKLLKIAVDNYGAIKAKNAYAKSSKAAIEQTKLDYLPNFNLSAQADYGTVNGQNGPVYTFTPVGIASSGLPLGRQNWYAAFGSLYLANVNWDFFAFGRAKQKIKTAATKNTLDVSDLQQEIFQHQVRVSAAYLNLLAAQRLTESYRKNLSRADTLRQIIVRKARKDLLAGVDSSQANAEVSNAKSVLLKAMTYEDEQNSNLIKLLGTAPQKIMADTVFIGSLPKFLPLTADSPAVNHPILEFYKNRILYSDQQVDYYKTFSYPTFSLGVATQARGSEFRYSYTGDKPNYTGGLLGGLAPSRANYVVAFGITWNLTQPFRVRQQVKSQRLISEGLKDEMEMTRQQLTTELNFSDTKIKNAIADYYETPLQVKAANDTYLQKIVLYNHGLTNLADVTQALYALVRAETDRDIAYNNVWQALLLKAASAGDFSLFYINL